uniref:Chymotrypsin B n=1 Tax=Schistocephalus solidus TaxID=70667 RepID=A0A0X3P4Z5_SCHSO
MKQTLNVCSAFLMSLQVILCLTTFDQLPQTCGRRSNLSVWSEEDTYSKPQAIPHSWPWQVGLWSKNRGEHPFCGGTILNNSLIITAARCVKMLFSCEETPVGQRVDITQRTGDILTVHAGDHKFSKSDIVKQLRQVKLVEVHPQFNPRSENSGYDVALLWLMRPLFTGTAALPICVSKNEIELSDGYNCYYAGWGAVLRKGLAKEWKNPRVLRQAEVTIAPYSECVRVSYPVSKDKIICLETEARAPCHGDNGGGLFCLPPKEQRWFLHGVIGGADEECVGDRAIATSMSSVSQWLEKTLGLPK